MASLRIPSSTYRLQFSGGFRFEDARALAPYLSSLGISDVYASPVLKARRGSTHGYDVTDPTRLDPEIGSGEDFEALAHELQRRGMGLLLDIVPNHLAASIENPWWVDVLENGPGSTYATYFDIDWHPPNKALENKVLLPLLARPYAQCLENQDLSLILEPKGFFVRYADMMLPVAPKSYRRILRHRADELGRTLGAESAVFREFTGILAAVDDLPERVALSSELSGERRLQREAIKERLARLYLESPEVHAFLNENLRLFNGIKRSPGSFLLLDELLANQAYVLAFWRSANEEINYRRFFTISDLVGVRVEDPLVFKATHEEIFRLVENGVVTGLRVDHVDGLRDPEGYLRRLQERLAPGALSSQRPNFYVVVEKILERGESLPSDWRVLGTTGYDFLNAANAVFVDERGFKKMREVYDRFVGGAVEYQGLVYEKKKQVMETILGVEMRALGHHLTLLAGDDRYARDLSMTDLTRALIEVTALLPVYRTYVRNSDAAPAVRKTIQRTVSAARKRNPGLNPACFDFLADVLAVRARKHLSPRQNETRLDFVMRWQQFSGPIMAKGVEDTALYIYNPLVSCNEVGGSPEACDDAVADFHAFCRKRAIDSPLGMNATTTHDTKRSEDVRARINVLSELPEEWDRRLRRWARWNESRKDHRGARLVPDRNEEILLYETMLGAWPLSESEVPGFRARLREYMVKAVREARVYTKWSRPNVSHEKALARFIDRILAHPKDNPFLADFLQFQRKISYYGALNAMSQVLLKMAAPGAPDFYQGSELWDLRLVDPDNRGPVDFDQRIGALGELQAGGADATHPAPPDSLLNSLLTHWEDGRIKLYLISRALNFRKSHAPLFEDGDYLSLSVSGGKGKNVCAFARRKGDEYVLAIAPRLYASLAPPRQPPLGVAAWEAANLRLRRLMPKRWINVLTREVIEAVSTKGGISLPLAGVLSRLPLALLHGRVIAQHERQRRS